MSIEISGSPQEAPLPADVPAAPVVEQPSPTSSTADAPDIPPVPESTLEVEQSAEAPNTLPETPVPDSALDVEQTPDPDQPATLPETPETALPIGSETDPATSLDETPAIPLDQAEYPGATAPTENLEADATENPVGDPEAPTAQVEADQSDTPPEAQVDEPPATTETDEPRHEQTTRADPETPERRESPLGKASEHPDRVLSPAEHEARKQAGLARSRELIGKENWANSKYAGETFYDALPQELKDKFPDGVDFSYEGFPIFDPYATHTVEFLDGFGATRDDDFSKANKEAGFADTPADYTWHHKEDGKTLLLVDAKLHGAIRHWGGVKITKLLSQDSPEARG